MSKRNSLENSKLKDFTKEQLIEIINKTANKDKSFREEIGESVNERKDDFEKENNYSKYCSLWEEAEEIISKFNEYGGGPEDEEDIVYKNLPEAVELFNNNKLDRETKIEFINNCFEQYYYHNSGFEDLLRDSIFDVCNCKEDWLLVIEKLKKSTSNYDSGCIMEIYKDKLNDDETYLKLRMASLHFGMDYFDLIKYYYEKKDINKAISVANEGIEKGEGRIIDLIEFLSEYYIKKEDYENTLKYKLLSFKDGPSFDQYKEIIRFCNESDSKKVLNELNDVINTSRDGELKAEVNYFNGNYAGVLEHIKSYHGDLFFDRNFKEWAQKLEPHFPKDILKIYLERVMYILEHKISKEYFAAEYYLKRIGLIFLDILHNKNEWEALLISLNKKSLKLPSFQKILRNLEEKHERKE